MSGSASYTQSLLRGIFMQDFAGKVAVITGAASGIGKALTEKCIAEGMHVVMADIEEAVLEKAAAELQATTNNQVLPIVANVAMEAELRKVRDEAVETLGGVHLLFNNAGVGGGGNSWNATQKDWDWVFGVNLWSVIYGLRVFVPQMIAQETPCHIVNTASIAGIIGGSTNALYSVTKHGVVALTENLSVDLKAEDTNIGCSVLCPGFVNTNIFNSGRNRPADLANREDPQPLTPEDEQRIAMFQEILRQGMQPAEIAEIVFDAIRGDRLYILTHDHFDEMIRDRAENMINGTNPLMGEAALSNLAKPAD
jgi:NAD(P)-dependent dehydrogenase (short-subunit alcohol dehydrogenase family)